MNHMVIHRGPGPSVDGRSKRAERRHRMLAGRSPRRRLTLVDPYGPRPSPTPYERHRARNRRLMIYAAIYSVAGLVAAGKLLFWWLQNG
jgi:hypothetical protein